jgi:mannonate dehydratase
MALEETWRWFGPHDPISLPEIKQTGATGIVTALHQIPVGAVWPEDKIRERKAMIEAEGMTWSVVESVPVHDDIKKRSGSFQRYINNYIETLKNLSRCGIDTVCYNFMPVLDWSRTDLTVIFTDGSITTRFQYIVYAAFDMFILRRPNAEAGYTPLQTAMAKEYFESLSDEAAEALTRTILYGLPGSLDALSLDEFRSALRAYEHIGDAELRANLYAFIRDIAPAAEASGIFMAIHADDPPWPLFGLPRVVSTEEDAAQLLSAADTTANGLTLCTGSFGAGYSNDLVRMAERFAGRINFLHLRNVTRIVDRDFMEADHLNGDIDLYGVMKVMLIEQQRRIASGRKDARIPMRPDHGHLMLPDMGRKNIYPGYSLFGRMRALAELRGMELALRRQLNLS